MLPKNNPRFLVVLLFALLAALSAIAGASASAEEIVVDLEFLTINGDPSFYNGVSFTATLSGPVGNDSRAEFVFSGDLNIPDNSSFRFLYPPYRSPAVSFSSLNNIFIGSGVTVDVSASDDGNPGPGGGTSGSGGLGGAAQPGGRGGNGGDGGKAFLFLGLPGYNGEPGAAGAYGSSGTQGFTGGNGFSASGSGGAGGSAGQGGSPGLGGEGGAGGIPAPGVVSEQGVDGWDGQPIEVWYRFSISAPSARAGSPGTAGMNSVTGSTISGGGAGGGGAGGNGGGSGGGGGGGGGAQGGGVSGSNKLTDIIASYILASVGGDGGKGGNGGRGGSGGAGQHGGAGGGAVEFVANGRMVVGGGSQFRSGGGSAFDSSLGRAGMSGAGGSDGLAGSRGLDGYCFLIIFCVGTSGDGGDGGLGGDGGRGGGGGNGGGGAGGTIKLAATLIQASDASVNTSGASGPVPGGDGRFLFASNVSGGIPTDIAGATLELYAGPRERNPLIKDGVYTPFIPDLLDGAGIYGLLQGVAASSLVTGNRRGYVAIKRLDVGPGDYAFDFTGFDFLLVINASDQEVTAAALGLSSDRREAPDLQTVESFPPGAVFATLVPEGDAWVWAAFGDVVNSPVAIRNGQTTFVRASESNAIPAMPTCWLLVLVLLMAGLAFTAIPGRARGAD